jgi:hypothetical protein
MFNHVIQRAKAEARQPLRLTAREQDELRRAVVILENLQGGAADDSLHFGLADVIDDLYGMMRAASISGSSRR